MVNKNSRKRREFWKSFIFFREKMQCAVLPVPGSERIISFCPKCQYSRLCFHCVEPGKEVSIFWLKSQESTAVSAWHQLDPSSFWCKPASACSAPAEFVLRKAIGPSNLGIWAGGALRELPCANPRVVFACEVVSHWMMFICSDEQKYEERQNLILSVPFPHPPNYRILLLKAPGRRWLTVTLNGHN